MRCSRNPHARRQRGFTLVEAMSAGVVLSVLALGLMHVWSAAGANVDGVVVREKAIWALNGQMERLVSLYQFTEFGDGEYAESAGYGYGAGYANRRLVYSQDSIALIGGLLGLLGGLLGGGEEDGFLVAPDDFATAEGFPVAVFTHIALPQRRNYVWIDRDRDIVGRLSWEEEDLEIDECTTGNVPGGAQPCQCFAFSGAASGGRCRSIMLSLEFPLRWEHEADDAMAMEQETEILSLRTIVGRR